MRMKYTAACALASWLVVTAWLSSMVIAKPAVLRYGNQAGETAEMAQLRAAIARNQKTLQGIEGLRGPGLAVSPLRPAVALPLSPAVVHGAGPASIGTMAGSTDLAAHVVSLILSTDGGRTAVIDGYHVRTGARLDSGERVAGIGHDWVRLLDGNGNARTYRVHNALAPRPAGGAR